MKISHAKYSTYMLCPFKYKAHYIDGLAAKYEKETPQLFLGNLIHEVLYKFFQIKEHSERTLDKLYELYDNLWRSDAFSSEQEEQEYYERGKRMLEDYFEKNDMTIDPLSLEEYFEIPIGDHIINGFIDRVDRTEGGVEIIDYKTGRYIPTQKEVDEDMQLTFYYIGYTEKHKDVKDVKLSVYYLDRGVKISTVRTQKDKKKGLKEIKKVIRRIEADREFKPTPNKFCNWCDYAILCPAKSIGKNEKEKFHHIVSNLYLINNLGRYLTSILDLDELYSIIINKVQGIAKATTVSLMLFDENKEYLRVVKSTGMTDEEIANFKIRVGEGLAGLAASTGNPVYVKDVWSDSRYIPFKEVSVKIAHPLVAIPLVYHDETIGVLNVERGEHEEFFENDMILLKNLAVNISNAIVNARLYNDLEEANKALDKKLKDITTLYKISKVVNTSKDIEEILNLALEVASTGFGLKYVSIFLREDGFYRARAAYGIELDELSDFVIKQDSAILSVLSVTEEMTEWADFKETDEFPASFKEEYKRVYVIPLKAAEEVRGLIVIFDKGGLEINDDMKLLLNIFALQIAPIIGMGIMIDKARKSIADPFTPMIDIVEDEIAKVREFDLNLDIINIVDKKYPELISEGKYDAARARIQELEKILKREAVAVERIIRSGKNSFLDILPANSEMDLNQKIERLSQALEDVEFKTGSYPADGETGFELVNKVL